MKERVQRNSKPGCKSNKILSTRIGEILVALETTRGPNSHKVLLTEVASKIALSAFVESSVHQPHRNRYVWRRYKSAFIFI